jgi:putative redox protein
MAKEALITWKEGHHFEASSKQHSIQIDAPIPTGSDLGINPMSLLLAALGSCTAMDVVWILEKERQPLTALSVAVHGEQAPEPPTVFTEITVHFKVRGRGLKREAVERAVRLSEEKYCSVGVMLEKSAHIQSTIEIEEES